MHRTIILFKMSLDRAKANIKDAVYFNGGWVKTAAKFAPGPAPAFGSPLPEAPKATVADVDAAVKSAAEAFKTWGKLPHEERANWLRLVLTNTRRVHVLVLRALRRAHV